MLFRRKIVDTTPRGPVTGFAHPRCYLARDRNCSQEISREHFISESILKIINVLNGRLMVSGFPWLKEPKDLPPAALASNILCKRHNEGLSGLDSVALRLYRHLSDIPNFMTNGPRGRTDKVLLFSGGDVERWMLKVLCGILVSGNAALGEERVASTPPDEWLDVLMGKRRLVHPLGLSIVSKPGDLVPMENRIGFAPLFGDGDRPVGALMFINGSRARADRPASRHRAGNGRTPPGRLALRRTTRRLMFNFAGEGWDEGRDIKVEWQRQENAAP